MYGELGLSEVRELRQLCEESRKLKRPMTDLSLDRHIVQEMAAKNNKWICSCFRSLRWSGS